MSLLVKFTIAVIFTALFLFFMISYFDRHQETERLSHTLEQTVQQLKQVETRSGQMAAENEVMHLRLKELTLLYPQLVTEIRNLKVNPRRTGQISAAGFRAEKNISVPLTDSLLADSARMKIFSFHNEWYDVRGQASDTIQHLQFRYQDTLIHVIYQGKRYRPWLWVLSPRRLRQRVLLKNPDGRIGYAEAIKIGK